MYTVKRENGKIIVTDWKSNVVYTAENGSILLYKANDGTLKSSKIDQLTDDQLLTGLANAVKIAL